MVDVEKPKPQANLTALLQQGVAAAKAGDKPRAQELLRQVTEGDPGNEMAWIWLATVSSTPFEARDCLEKVLAINPVNQQAQAWLFKIQSQLARITPGWTCPFCEHAAMTLPLQCPKCKTMFSLRDPEVILTNTGVATESILRAIGKMEDLPQRELTVQVHKTIAIGYLNIKQTGGAIAHFRLASLLDPEDAEIKAVLEVLLRRSQLPFKETQPTQGNHSILLDFGLIETSPPQAPMVDLIPPPPAPPTTLLPPNQYVTQPLKTFTAGIGNELASRTSDQTAGHQEEPPRAAPTVVLSAPLGSGRLIEESTQPPTPAQPTAAPTIVVQVPVITPPPLMAPPTVVSRAITPSPAESTTSPPPSPPTNYPGAAPTVISRAMSPLSPESVEPARPSAFPVAPPTVISRAMSPLSPESVEPARPSAFPAAPPTVVSKALTPLESRPADPAPAQTPPAVPNVASPAMQTVLVVDDSMTVRKMVAKILEKAGYNVEIAADGIEALAKLETLRPDLILLDITMPGPDGYKVCKDIKSNKELKHVNVLMLSGKDGFFDKIRGKMAGATEYITKPFEAADLLQRVEKYLKK